MIDGVAGEPFDAVSPGVAMSDDGGVVAYAARKGATQWCVVGREKGPGFHHVGNPVVSADGSIVAYAAGDAEGASIVVNGARGPRFRWVGNIVVKVGHVAYVAEDSEFRSFVVLDGKAGPAFERVTKPALADGRVAYGARRNGEWRIVSGAGEVAAGGEVTSVFSDGERVGWVIEEQRLSRVAGGKPFDWIGWPSFDRRGRPVYFAERDRVKLLVVGDTEIVLGEWVIFDPAFSADGTRMTFGARIGRELWRKVIALP